MFPSLYIVLGYLLAVIVSGDDSYQCYQDIRPPGCSTLCVQKAYYGQCDETWMKGYCCQSCPDGCSEKCGSLKYNCKDDIMPPNSYSTCAQMKLYGQCSYLEPGYCCKSCPELCKPDCPCETPKPTPWPTRPPTTPEPTPWPTKPPTTPEPTPWPTKPPTTPEPTPWPTSKSSQILCIAFI